MAAIRNMPCSLQSAKLSVILLGSLLVDALEDSMNNFLYCTHLHSSSCKRLYTRESQRVECELTISIYNINLDDGNIYFYLTTDK